MTKSKRSIERLLASVQTFRDPRADLEQYSTPADIAAHLVHIARTFGDIDDRTVVDLGAGTGMLALGCALFEPARVIGIERDPTALDVARTNERRVPTSVSVDWVRADATRPPVRSTAVTVVMNPPFGAQRSNIHADRGFLAAARSIARVSYSFHNEGSRAFVDAFVRDTGGTITHEWRVDFDLETQFEFHRRESTSLDVELYRIEWNQERPG